MPRQSEEDDNPNLHPAAQWAENLYTDLIAHTDIPERGVCVIGEKHDTTVTIATDPSCTVPVRIALQEMVYNPEMTDDNLGYKITPNKP